MRALALLLLLAAAGCGHGQPSIWPPRGAYHDPDARRGPLPDAASRRGEVAYLRQRLDAMYAHREDKLQRHGLDEDVLFAETAERLVAARSWAEYDEVLYSALARFHDGHLTYRPPPEAAPAQGYRSYRLGLTTVLGGEHLLIAAVDPGSELAAAGVLAGDEVVAIDGRPVAEVLARESARRAWSRERTVWVAFTRTWTATLVPRGDQPRHREVVVRPRRGGADLTVAITPREPPPHERRGVAEVRRAGDVAVVTLRSFDGGAREARAVDDALAEAGSARALILDLRGNRGGVDQVGYRVLADLAEGAVSLGQYRVLVTDETLARRASWKPLAGSAGPDGRSPPQPITVAGRPDGQGFHGPIVVLIDAGCLSTCEVVAAALRADLHATLVGETTGGSSGAPISITLPASKGRVTIPTWDLLSAEGKPIESDGVVPDVPAAHTPDALAQGVDLPLGTGIAILTS